MLIIRVLPKSRAIDALVICYKKNRTYTHNGERYFVESLSVTGAGRSSRIEAVLRSVWEVDCGNN